MDFLSVAPGEHPKSSYKCLAAITIGGHGGRRGSAGSEDNVPGDGLYRILSGGRRKSTQGAQTHTAADGSPEGTWYWRCRVGVTKDNLVIMPISNPPNPLLKSKPPPLSNAVPSSGETNGSHAGGSKDHHLTAAQLTGSSPPQHKGGFGGTVGGLGRRLSAALTGGARPDKPQEHPHGHDGAHATNGAGAHNGGQAHTDVSQNAATSDTGSVPAETGWPGVVEGQPLHGIIVPLHYIKKDNIHSGGKNKDGWHVAVNIGSAIAGKAGHLRFEFDPDWIGGKAEAELLEHNLQMGVQSAAPLFGQVQLGGSGAGAGATAAGAPGAGGMGAAPDAHAAPLVPGDKEYKADWKDDVRGRW